MLILHPAPGPAAGPLERLLGEVRGGIAAWHAAAFVAAGADDVRIVAGPADDTPFGARLRGLLRTKPARGGLVVLGSGAIPLARPRDHARLVGIAASRADRASANNRYSADVVALGHAGLLDGIPDAIGDNALPRWLEGRGVAVHDARGSARLQVDIDSPADAFLAGGRIARAAAKAAARAGMGDIAAILLDRAAAVRTVAHDPRSELLVAGRTSAGTLRSLERGVAARVRALVEERGLRTAAGGQRPPASVLGMALDAAGVDALGQIVARLAEAGVVDTRVLLAHRLGRDERRWPSGEDRFASDLLLADRIEDPWLRTLTIAARDAPVPVLLGGHTLVGPGLPGILSSGRARRAGR